MKYIKQFGIILGIAFLGEVLNEVVPLPVPASIYGIVILFLCLATGFIKLESISEVSTFLLDIMPILFVPAAVGLIGLWDVLKPNLWQYILIMVVSTVVVMVTAGRVTQAVIRFSEKRRAKKDESIS